MYEVSGGADCDTDHYMVVAKLRERLAVSKQAVQKFDRERFNLRKLNESEVKYQIEITNRFAALEEHGARMGEGTGVHRVLVGKLEGKSPLGRPRRRWEDNNKMDLQEVGGSCGDWMELAQDRDIWRALVITVRNLRVPKMRGIS